MHIRQSFDIVSLFAGFPTRNPVLRPFLAAIGLLVQLLVLLMLPLAASQAQEARPATLLLENVRVIIGDGSVLQDAAMLVADGRIVSVGQRSNMEVDESVEIIDLNGKTLVPAFIDSHAHLGYEGHRSWGGVTTVVTISSIICNVMPITVFPRYSLLGVIQIP